MSKDTTNAPSPRKYMNIWTRKIQLFHILTTLSVEDGAVHALHLNFNAQQVAEIVEYPVYPDYKLPDKGLLSLRAPPVF